MSLSSLIIWSVLRPAKDALQLELVKMDVQEIKLFFPQNFGASSPLPACLPACLFWFSPLLLPSCCLVTHSLSSHSSHLLPQLAANTSSWARTWPWLSWAWSSPSVSRLPSFSLLWPSILQGLQGCVRLRVHLLLLPACGRLQLRNDEREGRPTLSLCLESSPACRLTSAAALHYSPHVVSLCWVLIESDLSEALLSGRATAGRHLNCRCGSIALSGIRASERASLRPPQAAP